MHITRPVLLCLIPPALAAAEPLLTPEVAVNPVYAPGLVSPPETLPSIVNAAQSTPRNSPPITPPLNKRDITIRQQSSFIDYVKRVTGQELPVFGNDLFQSAPSTFAPIDAAQINGDYTLGPGDEIQIRGWGMVNIDLNVKVDRSGGIYLPRIGAINVAGVKYRDLQGYLKQAVGRVFTRFDLSASILQTHAVQVYVVGHAVRPGTYTLSAMSSLLNALFSSGGPSGTGTMRGIQLRRGSQVVSVFDMYDMLTRGDKSRDVSLQDGDVIFIPEAGPQIALSGAVKRPGIYELKGETRLRDALRWAGGFESGAEQGGIIIEKDIDNRYQTLIELSGAEAEQDPRLSAITLSAANVLRVFSPGSVAVEAIRQREFVRVSGEVQHTGVYQIAPGETLRALIERLGGVTGRGYLFATRLTRESARREQQSMLDAAAERFSREIETVAAQKSAGAIDKDAVTTQTAELERQRQLAQKLRTIRADGRIVLELDSAQAGPDNLPELALQDGDSIDVPRKPGTVSVLGAVFQSNSFIYQRERTVADYLALAGGPTLTGSKDDLYIIRADGTVKSNRNSGWSSALTRNALNPGDAVVVPEKIERSNWTQSLKDWTSILYQFGLGAAGLKVLKN